jgi:hypothetical protein
MPGRSTFTTTSRPSLKRATCTCAIEAAASGWVSKLANTSLDRLAVGASTSRAHAPSNGGTRSCSFASSSAMSGGSRSRRVGDGLAELHEDRPEFLEREPQALAARAAAAALEPGPGREQEDEAQRPVEMRGAHELVEPVAHQHALDLDQPRARAASRFSGIGVRVRRSSEAARAAQSAPRADPRPRAGDRRPAGTPRPRRAARGRTLVREVFRDVCAAWVEARCGRSR